MFCPVLAARCSMMMALFRDAEGDGVLGVMDGLAAREHIRRGGAVAAGEHQHREQPRQVQVGGERRDSQVVAA